MHHTKHTKKAQFFLVGPKQSEKCELIHPPFFLFPVVRLIQLFFYLHLAEENKKKKNENGLPGFAAVVNIAWSRH